MQQGAKYLKRLFKIFCFLLMLSLLPFELVDVARANQTLMLDLWSSLSSRLVSRLNR